MIEVLDEKRERDPAIGVVSRSIAPRPGQRCIHGWGLLGFSDRDSGF